MKSDDIKSGLYLALIAGGVYLAYQAYLSITAGASKVGAGIAAGASSASSTVADAVQAITGTGIAQPGGSYTVTMADGSVQTVPYGQLPVATATNGLGRLTRRRLRRE